jgi:predicted MPP superfamily phosphohydrolase
MFVMLAVVLGANGYVLGRVWQMIPSGYFLRPLWAGFVVVALAAFFLGMRFSGELPSGIALVLNRVGTSWVVILLYLLIALLLADLLRLTGLVPPLKQYMSGSWVGVGVLFGAMILIFTAGYLTYQHKKRVELTLEIPGNTFGAPLKIVAASDLHLGNNIGRKEFARWVDQINAEEPDVILFVGDLIDNSVQPLWEQDMAEEFHRLRAKYGVFAVPGNHEYISGLPASLSFLQAAGVTVLRDSVVTIADRLSIAGRDDRSNRRRKPIAALLESLDRDKPVVLLDHQPYHLEEAQANGVTLQLSGHTHRGQIWPISWITDRMYELSYGYARKGDTHFYVSSGLGLWGGKFRIGTRSEYVVVFLM